MSDKDDIRDMVMALSRGDHKAAETAASTVIANKTANLVSEGRMNPERQRRNRMDSGRRVNKINARVERGVRGRSRLGEDSDFSPEHIMMDIIQGAASYEDAYVEAEQTLQDDFDSRLFKQLYNDIARGEDDEQEYRANHKNRIAEEPGSGGLDDGLEQEMRNIVGRVRDLDDAYEVAKDKLGDRFDDDLFFEIMNDEAESREMDDQTRDYDEEDRQSAFQDKLDMYRREY